MFLPETPGKDVPFEAHKAIAPAAMANTAAAHEAILLDLVAAPLELVGFALVAEPEPVVEPEAD